MTGVPMRVWLPFLVACTTADTALGPPEAVLGEQVKVVPSPGLPDAIAPQPANNNLDVARHDGRVFLAWRTAPTHFASAETEMHVVSSEDEVTWRFEGTFALGTDLREPQLVSVDGDLWFYFATLGTNPIDFEPGEPLRTRYLGPGDWTEPETWGPPDFIPWRIKWMAGRWHVLGYEGGANVYEPGGDPLRIQWLASDDALSWEPAVPGQPVMLEGGGSETDAVFLDDGSLVAVVRNEAGDDDGFGSKICTAPADDLGRWTCGLDDRKYDSPLVLRSGGRVWLIARRNVTDDGAYDVADPTLSLADRNLLNQGAYWQAPKRCALWTVDPATRTVAWQADLPSRGDTCFPEALEDGEDTWVVYNYSNDPEGPERDWVDGQTSPTNIYRQVVELR